MTKQLLTLISFAALLFALPLLGITTAAAQNREVRGTVVDNNGDGIIGATVMVDGTSRGTTTGVDGSFSIQAASNETLAVSFIGYTDQLVPISGRTTINITLAESATSLDEVVVIGYGTTKAKNFTGSVEVVKMEDSPLSMLGVADATSILRGRLSGVVLGAESGTVGTSPNIMVRGQKRVGSTEENPLLILDGVIFSGNLNDIDPQSIESISVLKDATSLAAYGSKASQGVIMITTKKGKQGKPVISFSTTHAFSTPTYDIEYSSPADYIRYRNAKAGNSNLTDLSFMSFIEKENYENGKTTDWVDMVTQTGYTQTYNLSFSGATENSNYYISGGRTNQKGMIIGNEVARTNFSVNVSTKVASFIEIGANMNYTYTFDDSTPASLSNAYASPYGDAYLPNGQLRKFIEGGDNTATNPLWNSVGVDKDNQRTNTVFGGFLSVDIPWVEGLNFRVNGSYTRTIVDNKSFSHESQYPTLLTDDWEGIGQQGSNLDLKAANGSITNNRTINWVIDNILTYTREFGKHFVNGTLVYTRNSREYIGSSYSGEGFEAAGNTLLGWHGLGNATTKKFNSPSYSLHNDIGYLVRASYAYNDTYHLNASLRRDGSSVFGKDNKWGNFPAVGAAWTISNESFMQNVNFVDNLKLKLSWGKNGAQTLSPYGTLSRVSLANGGAIPNYYGGELHWGQAITTLGNPKLAWQTTTSWNGGFEADLFKRRLHFEINLYTSQTTEQIFDRKIPIMTAGISTQKATMGRVDNRGIEINASSVNIRNKDITWTSGLMFTLNRNELKELYGDGIDDLANGYFHGEPLSAIYGYTNKGIFQQGNSLNGTPGHPIFIDKDGNEVVTPSADDRSILGYGTENFRMSLSNTVNYKNFQLYVMFTGIFGGNGYAMGNNTFAYYSYNFNARSNTLKIPFYASDNQSNTYPSPAYNNPNGHYTKYNSYGHIRLQDVSLSYNLTPLVSQFGINNARVYVSGRNLFYYAPNWKLSDPEARGSGTTQLPRTITFGLNLTF